MLQLINLYRVRGHLIANLDPLKAKPPQITPSSTRPATASPSGTWTASFVTGGLAGQRELPLGEILHILRDAYCRTGRRRVHAHRRPTRSSWIQEHVEGVRQELPKEDQRQILHKLNEAEAFERFLHTKYVGHKRFCLEGAESLIPMLDAILDEAADAGHGEPVIGMAHRGRLNVLANIVGKSYGQIFGEFEGNLDPTLDPGLGRREVPPGRRRASTWPARASEVRVEVASNPSHLEAVDPVVEGIARAKQDLLDRGEDGAGPADPDPRRRRLRRPGRGGRDAQPVAAPRLPHRRHRPHRGQQPDRVHHLPRRRPLDAPTPPTWPR